MTNQAGIPRIVEIVLAAVGLAVCLPLLAVAALLIRITSAGPAIFRQKRVGVNGEVFTLLKLRTMHSVPGSLVTSAGDSRITAVGRILRRSKIDELPELWNVLRGDMSFVGPRPEVSELVDLKDPLWRKVLTCRPGLTDPVTLSLRNEEQLLSEFEADSSFYKDILQPYKLRGYIEFIEQRSWSADVGVLFKTMLAIVFPYRSTPPSRSEMLIKLAQST